MTPQTKTPPKAHYLAEMAAIPANGHPEWANALRARAAARFQEAEYPHVRMEAWRHTNIAPIVNTIYASAVKPHPHGLTQQDIADKRYGGDWIELVFVDGWFAPGLSHTGKTADGVYAGSLYDALCGPDARLAQPHLGNVLRGEDAFTALNAAFLRDGAMLYVPPNTVLETPVHLLFLSTARRGPHAAHLRNLIILERNSEATVTTTYAALSDDASYFNNVAEEIVLNENARLDYSKNVNEGAAGNHLAVTECAHARDSRCHAFMNTAGGNIVRNEYRTRLEGAGASCDIGGLYLNDGQRLIDNTLHIRHAQPNCNSRIHCRGILSGESRAVYLGKVHVLREAQKTDSNQLNSAMLLSGKASIDAKPQLEIYADDVKCTHGTTVGAPPPEVIYYFRSRGIDEAAARAMLTRGFAEEAIRDVKPEAVRERLRAQILAKYGAKRLG